MLRVVGPHWKEHSAAEGVAIFGVAEEGLRAKPYLLHGPSATHAELDDEQSSVSHRSLSASQLAHDM